MVEFNDDGTFEEPEPLAEPEDEGYDEKKYGL